jgi:hypothetical protein
LVSGLDETHAGVGRGLERGPWQADAPRSWAFDPVRNQTSTPESAPIVVWAPSTMIPIRTAGLRTEGGPGSGTEVRESDETERGTGHELDPATGGVDAHVSCGAAGVVRQAAIATPAMASSEAAIPYRIDAS